MTKRLSVLQVSQYGVRGGLTTAIFTLATELLAQGIETTVLFFQDSPLRSELVRRGVRCEVIFVNKYDLPALFKLGAYLKRNHFDVVHTHGARAMLYGNPMARAVGASIILTTFHAAPAIPLNVMRLPTLYLWSEGLLSRLCTDQCIAFADRVRLDSIRDRKVPAHKICCIYNGVDTQKFHKIEDPLQINQLKKQLGLSPDDVVIGAVGHLIMVKGHRYLIAALAQIKETIKTARVVIAGAGPLRVELEALAMREGVSADVIFTGDISDTHLIYNCFDLFVYPSTFGVFGLVVLEAMACGVPVIVSKLDGTTELITHDESGVLVPPADSQALADAVVSLLLDPKRKDRIAAAGQAHVIANFSAANFVRQHITLYQALLEKKRPHTVFGD